MPGQGIIRPGAKRAAIGIQMEQVVFGPLAADVDRMVVAVNMATAPGASQDLTLANTVPDPAVGRMLSYSVATDAGAPLLTAGFLTVGIDIFGEEKRERISGVTLAGGAVLGSIAFRSVSAITAFNESAATTDAGDQVQVGIAANFAVNHKLKLATDVHDSYRIADIALAPTVLADAGTTTIASVEQGYAYYTPDTPPTPPLSYILRYTSTFDETF